MPKKPSNEPPAPPAPANRMISPDQVRVRVIRQPLMEETFRAVGDTFTATAERAAALGDAVEILSDS